MASNTIKVKLCPVIENTLQFPSRGLRQRPSKVLREVVKAVKL